MPAKADPKGQHLQRHRLTLAQLASYDDVLTDALAYYWSRIRKNRENKYLPLRGIKQDEVPQILLHRVIIAKDAESAEKALLNLAGLRRYLARLRTEPEKKDFRSHLRKYVNMYLPDCPFEVSTTNRYTVIGHEAAVTARKRVREGDRIKYLCGTLVPLTDAELVDLDLSQRNFSIVQSDRKKNTLIFLGPARFANHDCAANGRLVSVGKDGLQVYATRNIELGEEITVTYSPGYFGANNEECLCHTCELQVKNGWASADASGAPQSRDSTPIPDNHPPETPYSFRKRRKHGLEIGSDQVDGSPPWPKKLKSGRPPSRLNQVLTPPRSSTSLEVAPILLAGRKEENEPCKRTAPERNAPDEKSRSDTEISGIDLANTTIAGTAFDPPKKRKLRLIDQMSPSASSSPERLGKTSSCSTPDESGSNPSMSKVSSRSTQAGSIIETAILLQVERTRDAISPRLPAPPLTETKVAGLCEPGLGKGSPAITSDPDIAHTSLPHTECKDSDIFPSIEESPTPELRSIATVTVPAIAEGRTPGDYILTRRLIAQPFDRWVHCQTCFEYFLQSNGYQTRRECPRCERHSMLYGFGWPKTEPDARRLREIKETREKAASMSVIEGWGVGKTIVVDSPRVATTEKSSRRGRGRGGRSGGLGRSGRSGKGSWVEGGGEDEREERVMDHRTVNRFVAPEEEREVRKRGRDKLLDYANRPPVGNGSGNTTASGNDTIVTPDRILLARIKGHTSTHLTALAERRYIRGSNASPAEESVGSGATVEGVTDSTALLRRSQRYFA